MKLIYTPELVEEAKARGKSTDAEKRLTAHDALFAVALERHGARR